jgi:NADPH:quinone reductase-like Zn-dependent oxidoreductase
VKAAVIEHYGSPKEFKIKDLPTPKIKEGQVLIRNRASSVNPVDTLVRQGKTMLVTGIVGDQLLGSDFSGTIIESQSSLFKPGDEVFGVNMALKGGAYAQEIIADQDNVYFKPSNLTFIESAVLPLVSLTAWQGLVQDGHIKQGDRVLITGCTGGVGSVAVQIAKTFNAHVTGTCSKGNEEFARLMGTDEIVIYDEEQLSDNHKFDLIFDASGHFTIEDLKKHLTEKAMFVSTKGGADSLKGIAQAAWDMAFEKRMKIVVMKANPEDLERVAELAMEGKIKPYIAKIFSLEELAEAHEMMEQESFNGKLAINIS